MTTVKLQGEQQAEENARLEALLLEGLTSGGGDIPLTREFWAELKREARGIAARHGLLKSSC